MSAPEESFLQKGSDDYESLKYVSDGQNSTTKLLRVVTVVFMLGNYTLPIQNSLTSFVGIEAVNRP